MRRRSKAHAMLEMLRDHGDIDMLQVAAIREAARKKARAMVAQQLQLETERKDRAERREFASRVIFWTIMVTGLLLIAAGIILAVSS